MPHQVLLVNSQRFQTDENIFKQIKIKCETNGFMCSNTH